MGPIGSDDGQASAPLHGHFSVASGSRSPAAARAWVERWLDGRVSERTAYEAMLVVSELVTNSVVHSGVAAGASVELSADLAPGVLRLEVGDLGAGGDVVRIPPPDRLSAGGFGLAIVASLGARWGVVHAGGTVVWCELALPATA